MTETAEHPAAPAPLALHEEEVKELLLFIQAGDNRTLSRVDLELWMSELPRPLGKREALEAVKAFRARPELEIQRHSYLDLPTFRVYLRKVRERAEHDLALAAARREASSRALPSSGKKSNTRTLRDRDPAAWDQAFRSGRILGNGDRAYQVEFTRTRGDVAAAEQARNTEQQRTAEMIATEEQQAALKARGNDPVPLGTIINTGGRK